MVWDASAWRVRSIGALSLALLSSACGGATRSDEPTGGAGPTQTGGAGPTSTGGAGPTPAGGAGPASGGGTPGGGTGQGGSWAATGTGGQSEPGSPIAGVKLDDTFPWFQTTATGAAGLIEPQMDADGNPLLHLGAEGEPAQATLSTHHHFEVVRYTSRIEFSSKSSEPLSLRVSVKRSLDTADYFAALAGGELWPTATVEVGADWRGYSVPFSTMQPAETSQSGGSGPGSFMIAFIVDHPESVDVWLDDVRLE